MKLTCPLILFIVALTLLPGCKQTQEIGKTTKQLFTGTTDGTVDRTADDVQIAIDSMVNDMNLYCIGSPTTRSGKNGVETTAIIRNSSDQRITVMYRPVSDTRTHVVVGTGSFGDSELRQNVWDALRLKLGVLNSPSTQP